MSNNFQKNDLVRLSTGGPVMVVINPEGACGEVWCSWEQEGQIRRDAVAAASLECLGRLLPHLGANLPSTKGPRTL